jgi:hypothetical protein
MHRPAWIHGPGRDVALALCWVPFAVAVVAIQGHRHLLAAALSSVLLLSLSHQPVTLALVYGDGERFRAHRPIYVLGPAVALGVVLLGMHVSLLLVAIAAGLWNAEHTLMQRYGVTRLYGRKAGDDHGGLERPMLFSWLAVAMIAVAANPRTPRYLAQVELGDVNRRGITFLTRFRPEATLLLVPALVVAAALTRRWVRAERAAPAANPAKWVYVGATAALIATVCVDPVAGFAAYVGAHAIEYFVIVRGAADRRAARGEGGVVGRAVRSPMGPTGFVTLASVGAVAPLMVLGKVGSFTVATSAYLTVGALHIFYDGLIWKQRAPAVARDLAAYPDMATAAP